MLGGPQSWSGGGGKEKNSQPLPRLEPPIIHPVTQLKFFAIFLIPSNQIPDLDLHFMWWGKDSIEKVRLDVILSSPMRDGQVCFCQYIVSIIITILSLIMRYSRLLRHVQRQHVFFQFYTISSPSPFQSQNYPTSISGIRKFFVSIFLRILPRMILRIDVLLLLLCFFTLGWVTEDFF
jgi:hypothetical protein